MDEKKKLKDQMSEADFTKLRNSLGFGYVAKMKVELFKITGRDYSDAHIRKALRKETAVEHIVEIAIRLRDKRQRDLQKIKS